MRISHKSVKYDGGSAIVSEIKNNKNIVIDVADELKIKSINCSQNIFLNVLESNIDKVQEQIYAFQEAKDTIEIYKDLLNQEILNIEAISSSFEQVDKEMCCTILKT